MAQENLKILSAEEEAALLAPINEYVGEIQAKIDALRLDGTDRVLELERKIESYRRDKLLAKEKKNHLIEEVERELKAARETEAAHKPEVSKLISQAITYIKAHYDKDYYRPMKESCANERRLAKQRYQETLTDLKQQHAASLQAAKDASEVKDEKYVYKNRCFDAKVQYEKELERIKNRLFLAFGHKFHLIDLLRMSRFTFAESQAQKWGNYRFTFNRRLFLLQNGLYIAILLVFIILSIITPIVKNTQLLTYTNILNILQQASPRMFLALGVSGVILLTGTDLSIGRMIGMGMTASTIIMHKGINTGAVFGKIFDFTHLPIGLRAVLALVVCIILCTFFAIIAGFFTARFKMHPFISTMANMLIIFGLLTYATKGVSFGAIESDIPNAIIPKIKLMPNTFAFPTIILWALAAIIIVWFIWNKTTFGKNLYAVGGNPEAAAVSGISVFAVTLGAFILAGILYGFGAWLECLRMFGSGSAAYGQGWEMDAIAACVVGGVSFTGGIGKISGVVTGVIIFTGLTYALTILGIDTNLQFVFSGIIIMVAVTLDCLKYVQKK
ncbi:MAG: galactoside ABC transporter permease [Eubacteriales bacterium]|nr:galactoside ABC transporter permease [Eubacteriales bacterium]